MKERVGYRSIKMTTHEQDKSLVKLALEGDQKSYNTLLKKYKPIIYTAAKRRLPYKSVEDLEDIVMVVLGGAFVKLHQYNAEKSKFFTWMIACLHNYVNNIPKQKKQVIANYLSDIYPHDEDAELIEYQIRDEDQFDEQYDIRQSYNLLKLLMKKLPEEIYQVMYMKFFRECTNEEIAETLGINKNDIFYRVKKGRELLKKYSKNHELF